ncbi:MAG TPA: FecR domain-containing protein [Candidatus Wallbacteria bacterium]|nr:FecR domain-containing protein [Candidatus Wallbacteria bacterium]
MKKYIKALFIILAVIIMVASSSSSPECADRFSARITALSGDVSFKANAGMKWAAAAVNDKLTEGAYLMTAFESSCSLEFMDGSKMNVRELSKIQINKFSSELKKVETEVTLYNGKLRATVHKDISVKTDFKVRTPVSTISVRGTEKEITSLPGFGTNVQNISGLVEVRNLIGQTVLLEKGNETKVSADSKRPDDICEGLRLKAKKTFAKNESMTPDEEETRLSLRAGFDMEAAVLRDLFEIEKERQIYPTSVISINWSAFTK